MGYQGNYPPSTPLNPTQLGTGVVTTDAIANGAVIPADLSTGGPYWDTSGNVGIGTTSPAYKLDVSGSARVTSDVRTGNYYAYNSVGSYSGLGFYGDAALTIRYAVLETQIGTATILKTDGATPLIFGTNASERMRIDSSGNVGIGTSSPANKLDVNGSISDSIGNVRSIPQNSQTTGYTLVASDNGKHISITTGGVTVPASVFSVGQVVSVYNNSGSNQTITQGATVTLRQAGTANTGNRTLAQYGLCTIICVASNTFVISGSGLS